MKKIKAYIDYVSGIGKKYPMLGEEVKDYLTLWNRAKDKLPDAETYHFDRVQVITPQDISVKLEDLIEPPYTDQLSFEFLSVK